MLIATAAFPLLPPAATLLAPLLAPGGAGAVAMPAVPTGFKTFRGAGSHVQEQRRQRPPHAHDRAHPHARTPPALVPAARATGYNQQPDLYLGYGAAAGAAQASMRAACACRRARLLTACCCAWPRQCNADAPVQYSFDYPADWEAEEVTKTEKSTMVREGGRERGGRERDTVHAHLCVARCSSLRASARQR